MMCNEYSYEALPPQTSTIVSIDLYEYGYLRCWLDSIFLFIQFNPFPTNDTLTHHYLICST